jgi:hypothetical protein
MGGHDKGWRGLLALVGLSACGSLAGRPAADDGSDASPPDVETPYVDAMAAEVGWPTTEGGFLVGEAGVVRADRFVTNLVDVSYGACAGFGQGGLPTIIEGPPVGAGTSEGSLDVLSLGNGGSLVVSFEPNAIVDGPGVDFIVFENPFWIGGDPQHPYAEPGVVSVSDDGVTWKPFPCTATNASGAPYGSCAGHSPVYSAPTNGISPFDPAIAGGDAFDLADVGLTRARYVRIVDQGGEPCTAGSKKNNNGFDLDAIAIINAALP